MFHLYTGQGIYDFFCTLVQMSCKDFSPSAFLGGGEGGAKKFFPRSQTRSRRPWNEFVVAK
jgi:hypothetical protein